MIIAKIIEKYQCRLDDLTKMASKVGSNGNLTIIEREKILELFFLDAYKNYELTIETLFIKGMLTQETIRRKRFSSYVHPLNSKHAKGILLLDDHYLDWTNPSVVIDRAKVIFRNHDLISDCITNNMTFLRESKNIRNAIAHESEQSHKQLSNIIIRYLGTTPIRRKTPGWFLNQNYHRNGAYVKILDHFLKQYYDLSRYFL